MDIKIEGDATPIAEGVKTNLDAIPTGMSYVFKLIFGNKITESYRKRLLVMAQTQKDITLIEQGKIRYDEGVLTPTAEFNLADAFRENKENEELNNILGCCRTVIEEFSLKKYDATDKTLSQTFINRWRHEAQFISEPELQQLWGKILTEELYAPNTINTKALETLKYFTKRDAELFTEICNYVTFNQFVIFEKEIQGIPDDFLDKLVDYGIINPFQSGFNTSNRWLKTQLKNDIKAFFIYYADDYHIIAESDKEISTKVLQLTYTGKLLYKIARNITERSLTNFCDYLLSIQAFKSAKYIHAENLISTETDGTAGHHKTTKIFIKQNPHYNENY